MPGNSSQKANPLISYLKLQADKSLESPKFNWRRSQGYYLSSRSQNTPRLYSIVNDFTLYPKNGIITPYQRSSGK